jgi:hypothetical protein
MREARTLNAAARRGVDVATLEGVDVALRQRSLVVVDRI